MARRVAPSAIVVGEGVVGRAEVGGGDGYGAGQTPLGVVVAPHLVAGAAAQPAVEESSTQRCSACTIPLAIQVAVSTCSTCNVYVDTKNSNRRYLCSTNCKATLIARNKSSFDTI